MGMVFTQDIAHDARGLDGLGARGKPHGLHRIEDASLDRFLAVAHVGQRPSAHYGYGVIEIGLLGVARQRELFG